MLGWTTGEEDALLIAITVRPGGLIRNRESKERQEACPSARYVAALFWFVLLFR